MRICICILYLILIHSLLSVPQHGQPSERTSVLAFLHSMVSDSLFKNMMKLMFRYKLQVELFFSFFSSIFVISFIDLFYLQNASWPNLQAGAPLSGFHLSIFLFLDNWYVFSSSLFIMFFLATLVALHFTPVSESVSQSVGRIFELA